MCRNVNVLIVVFFVAMLIIFMYYKKSMRVTKTPITDQWSGSALTTLQSDQWSPPTLPASLHTAAPDDPALVQHLRSEWLLGPPEGPRHLAQPDRGHYSQVGQSEAIDSLLGNYHNGFFIECGAGNGERLSNSLFFEKTRNWTGLLIEPNPDNFNTLLRKQRHAYVINACLSPEPRPMVLELRKATLASALVDFTDGEHSVSELTRKGKYAGVVRVQCFPLTSILLALGVSRVDYFSLDVEGPELAILKTVPFKDVDIRALSVEYDTMDKAAAARKKADIRDLLEQLGYSLAKDLHEQDVIMVKQH